MTSLMLKLNILIEKLENQKESRLIKDNKLKIENFIKELPGIIENIFEQERELSLQLMNITINE